MNPIREVALTRGEVPRALSLVETGLGHGTYVALMSKYFDQSKRTDTTIIKFDEARTAIERGFRRVITSGRVPTAWARRQNLDLFRIRSQLGNSFIARSRARDVLNKSDYSVLHFHTQALSLLSLDIMRRWPTVLTIDFTSDLAAREYTSPAFRWTHVPSRSLDSLVFRAAYRVVSWSELARQSAISAHGVSKERVVVIPPGVDVSLLKPPEGGRRERSVPRLLFIGTDFERKGGTECVAVLRRELLGLAVLDCVTNSDLVTDSDNVRVHRNVAAYSPQWLKLLRQADIFVLPTRADAYAQVVVEAMAAGLPVISTNINAIPEMVAHNRSGYLIPAGDRAALGSALRDLVGDRHKRMAFGEAGRRIAEERFDASKNFRRLEDEFIGAAISKRQPA